MTHKRPTNPPVQAPDNVPLSKEELAALNMKARAYFAKKLDNEDVDQSDTRHAADYGYHVVPPGDPDGDDEASYGERMCVFGTNCRHLPSRLYGRDRSPNASNLHRRNPPLP